MTGQIPDEVIEFIREHTTMSLGTIGEQGEPQVADVYYAVGNDLGLYFVSSSKSRHTTNMSRDSRVAATIHNSGGDWQSIRGVQIQGHCTRLTGGSAIAAFARYAAAYPYVLSDPTLVRAFKKVEMYRMAPNWIRWIDNSRSFGDYQEFHL